MFKLHTLTRLVRRKRRMPDGKVVTVTTADTVRKAVGLMIRHDFSQLPVINGQSGQVEGVISTDSIVRALYHLSDPNLHGGAAIDVMELSVAQCIEEAPIHPGDSDMLAMGETLADVPYVLVGKDGVLADLVSDLPVDPRGNSQSERRPEARACASIARPCAAPRQRPHRWSVRHAAHCELCSRPFSYLRESTFPSLL